MAEAANLVARLRELAFKLTSSYSYEEYPHGIDEGDLIDAAAKEIERLRDENEALRHSILHPVAVVVHADETSKSPWCGNVHYYGSGFTCRKLAGHIGPHGCHDAIGQLCEWTEPTQMADPDPADKIPPLV